LVFEVRKPNVDVDLAIVENSFISYLPYLPRSNGDYFHEKGYVLLLPGVRYPQI
jgi:hypothetical protein